MHPLRLMCGDFYATICIILTSAIKRARGGIPVEEFCLAPFAACCLPAFYRALTGRDSGAAPNSLLGVAPMTNRSSPPAMMSSYVMYDLS